ncbi:MAG: DUF938 domain-containing protein [Alphaproteobacteria bacterium]|nr:MAG: DUF938 domain-containing protein [Alphaproteobacteria bacterium]
MADRRQFAPATERNRAPILSLLKKWLPTSGTVLEVASGSGEHAVYFAPHFPDLYWQPSNFDPAQIDSVIDWIAERPSENLLSPVLLDATSAIWAVEEEDYDGSPVTAVFNANMIHISPWEVCEGLMAGAGRILPSGGPLILYGPYRQNSAHTAKSNEEFDLWLKSRNPAWGVRDQEQVIAEAEGNGLTHLEAVPMPANNFIQIFRKD